MPGTGYTNLWIESVSDVTATPSVSLGERRVEKGKEYVYVYNHAGTATTGLGMVTSAMSAYSVTLTSALKDRCFGVVQNSDFDASSYGWLQVKGAGNVSVQADQSAGLGDGIYLKANGLFKLVQTGATGLTYIAMEAGYMLEDVDATKVGVAYLGCEG